MYRATTISTALLLGLQVRAQTTDAVNSFLSEAFSVYTEVTSILASDASNTASSTTSSSSTTTTSSSSTSATSTSSKTTSTRPTAVAAAASTSAAAHSGGGISGTNLAIILGCVLGALALSLLALVLVLCCRRRRHTRDRSSRLLSPDGEEIESWKGHKNRPGSRDGLIGPNERHNYRNENAVMPSMAEHPAFANDRNYHQNPFVPVPPAPRRSAPNSRAGLTDGTVPGQEPFVSKSDGRRKSHNHAGEVAAGVGGAALGAAALHHHDENKLNDDHNGNDYRSAYDEKPAFARRPLPDHAYPTTTTNDDAHVLNKIPSRKSGEATRPYNGADYGYGTGPREAGHRGGRLPNTSAPLSPFNGAGHHRGPSGDNDHHLMAAGAGAVRGAALAHHHHSRDRSNSTPRRSYDSAKTPGPNALLEHSRQAMPQPMPVQDSHPARDLVSPISSDSYSSATGVPGYSSQTVHSLSGSTAATNNHHIPSEMPGDMPTPPPSSSPHRRSSSGGAPAAAALAHHRNQTPPNVPGRSPKRTRFSDEPNAPVPARTSDHTSSDDSTWRLSSGMPGGWGRNSSRRDSSPAANSEHLRNAGINPMGRAESPMRQSMPAGTGRRLRLADLKREEEERMEMERRGRQSMGSEWGGQGAYDGYEHGQGVGQAM